MTGGGIAIVFRSSLKVERILPSAHPTTFEQLCVKLISASRRVNIVIVYRPPPRATALFFDELGALWDDLVSLPGQLIVCGDVNCPGDTAGAVDWRLGVVLGDRGLQQCVTSPTRSENLLDVVISDTSSNIVSSFSTSDVDFSDHRLVNFNIAAPIMCAAATTFTYIDLKRVDMNTFQNQLRQSPLFISSPKPVNEYFQLMNSEVTRLLGTLAPMKSNTKRAPARPSAK